MYVGASGWARSGRDNLPLSPGGIVLQVLHSLGK